MSTWIDVFNHALAAALPGLGGAGGAFAVREARLEPDGFRLVAGPPGMNPDEAWVLRGRIEGEHAGRQRVAIAVEHAPEQIPSALAPFRALLESARFSLDLDFRGEAFRA